MAEFLPFRVVKLYRVRRESLQQDYRALYRFNKMNFEWISDHFLGENFERRGGALSNLDRMGTFLRYVGDPGSPSGVAEDVGIDRTTVSKTISDVMAAILLKKNVWIKFPSTREEMEQQKANWQEKYRFPSAIGAVDCTQIPIRKPSDHSDEYINRKGFPSINVQATCNFAEEFTSVDASWPGSVHDARIWRNSDIYRIMEFNALLIGDSQYHRFTPIHHRPYLEHDTDRNHIVTTTSASLWFKDISYRFLPERFFSINAQICDADMKIMNVVSRWPGSTHDARIWDNSVVAARFEAGIGYMMVYLLVIVDMRCHSS
ncbi:putative nuclease HARBI1 [Homalodisca vitripennis]|uniref:putative nuclease HARBI1 n=1 Tax=Homalodisca vitripennis TaxID=197043 RepID=UPI001EEBDC96|nr:putative nuclease HARBI1 [Homalodisca vitripennis]